MDRSSPYFVISGLISLSLFTFFLILFFIMMFSNNNINTFALKKDSYISISLDTVVIPSKKINKPAAIKKEETTNVETTKEVDVSDLFSDVWAADVKIEKKKVINIDNTRLELIQKKILKSDQNSRESIDEVIKSQEDNKVDADTRKNSTGDEVNEYFAKIQAIVYKYFEPPANSEGYRVDAVLELSAFGKIIDFRILRYSSNQALNNECDKIKSRLLGVLFPSNPNNKSTIIKIPLISDK